MICVLAFIQCSVVRNGKNRKLESINESSEQKVLESTKKQNITGGNFTIDKADIQITTSKGTEKVIVSIKYEKPDRFLVSIKSKVGIEIARILISEDTLLINDRINRKLYYGSSGYLKEKYGITFSIIPLLFGDYIEYSNTDNYTPDCSGGILNRCYKSGSLKIEYLIDCKKGKAVRTMFQYASGKTKVDIKYEGFLNTGSILFPGKIKINDSQSSVTIDIKIKKIETALKGKVEFIPGNRYELIRLR